MWEAFRQNSETIGFRPELKHPLPRWTAPLQAPASTAAVFSMAAILARIAGVVVAFFRRDNIIAWPHQKHALPAPRSARAAWPA